MLSLGLLHSHFSGMGSASRLKKVHNRHFISLYLTILQRKFQFPNTLLNIEFLCATYSKNNIFCKSPICFQNRLCYSIMILVFDFQFISSFKEMVCCRLIQAILLSCWETGYSATWISIIYNVWLVGLGIWFALWISYVQASNSAWVLP
jgi:hypothetical protein